MKTLAAFATLLLSLAGSSAIGSAGHGQRGTWTVLQRDASKFVAAYWDGQRVLKVHADYSKGIGTRSLKVTKAEPGEVPVVLSRSRPARGKHASGRENLWSSEEPGDRRLVYEAFLDLTPFIPVEAPWDPSYGVWRQLAAMADLDIADLHRILRERGLEDDGLILWPPGRGPRTPEVSDGRDAAENILAAADLPEGAREWCCIGGCCGTPAIGGRDCTYCQDEPYSCQVFFTECGEICRSGDVCNELADYFNAYYDGSELCGSIFDCCPHSGNHWGGWFCQDDHFGILYNATIAYRDSLRCRGFDGQYACLAKGADMSDHNDFVRRVFAVSETGNGWYCLMIPSCGGGCP